MLSVSGVPIERDSGRRLDGTKPLGLTRRLESAHLTFPLAGKLMRDFRAIAGVAFRVVRYLA